MCSVIFKITEKPAVLGYNGLVWFYSIVKFRGLQTMKTGREHKSSSGLVHSLFQKSPDGRAGRRHFDLSLEAEQGQVALVSRCPDTALACMSCSPQLWLSPAAPPHLEEREDQSQHMLSLRSVMVQNFICISATQLPPRFLLLPRHTLSSLRQG